MPCSSFNGYSSARALAKLYGNVVNTGNNEGKDILSKPTVELLDKVQANGTDVVLQFEMAWSEGLMKIPVPTVSIIIIYVCTSICFMWFVVFILWLSKTKLRPISCY